MTERRLVILPPKETIDPAQQREIVNKLVTSLHWISPILNPDVGKVEPPANYRRDGMLAYADGTNWNPGGLGKGLYRYNSATSAWVNVG